MHRLNYIVVCVAGVVGVGPAALGQCGPIAFDGPVDYEVPQSPLSVASGDFNGDGLPDLVTANRDSGSASVLYGVGAGMFIIGPTIPVGAGPQCVVAADFTGDGLVDFATANSGTGTVVVVPSTGAGFGGPMGVFAGGTPRFLAACDLDQDGDRDLLVARNGQNALASLYNNGNGTFVQGSPVGGFSQPNVVVVTHLNGDGFEDLVVASTGTGHVAVRLGNGAGNFAMMPNVPVNGPANGLVVADLDGDGLMDIATANSNAQSVAVVYGTGGGQFGGMQSLFGGVDPHSIAAADFDGDGLRDLVVSNGGGASLDVYSGQPGRTWAPPLTLNSGQFPRWVLATDVSLDGVPDVVCVSEGASQVSVYLNGGLVPAGIAQQPASVIVKSGEAAALMVVASGSNVQYQWRKGGVPVVNGGVISGQGTATLSFSSAGGAEDGIYDVIVSNPCGAVTSQLVYVAVRQPECGSPDFDGDGDIGTDADIEAFFRVLGGGSC